MWLQRSVWEISTASPMRRPRKLLVRGMTQKTVWRSPLHLYEANRWIYGDGAFGLRLAAWIARKAPDVLVDTTTLLMFRLREVPGAILPSDKIQRGMSGIGTIIPASRKFFTRRELN
jgi:hypothetical protein